MIKYKNQFLRNIWFTVRTFCLSTGALYVSCQAPWSAERKSTGTSSDAPRDTVPYTMTAYLESSPYYPYNGQGYDTTYFRATYPLSRDSQFNALMMQSFAVSSTEDLEHIAESFLGEYNSYVEEAPQPEYVSAWFQDLSTQVMLYTPGLLVVRHTIHEYTGGAHGNFAELFYNYALPSGTALTLQDIVSPDKQPRLREIAERYFRRQEGLDAQASLTENYFFEGGVFSLANSFALGREGLLFQYNPYEIKSYAEGTTQLIIPYRDIAALLTVQAKDWVQDIKKHNH